MKKQLIITTDDFGYSRNRNCGIVEAFLAGAITRASLIVNAEASQDAAKLAIQHSIPLGKNKQQLVIFPKNSCPKIELNFAKNN